MSAPTSSRPAVRGQTETLPWAWAEERLRDAWNFWLATASPDRGPHVRPVWAVWCGLGLLFTTSPTSRKARDFRADPRVAVHAELVREVVVVDGLAGEVDPGPAELDAYAAKYRWTPPDGQLWFAVRPLRAYAAIESSYPQQATEFEFA